MLADERMDLARDRVLDVETPENVRIEVPLAGPGSRFSALFLDTILVVVLMVAVPLGLLIPLGASDLLHGYFLLALTILWIFGVFWGYFLFFEAFRDGQTPGKRWMSIRVVMEDGTPVTFEAAAIRNLLRFLDLQPFPGCLVGGFFMLLGRKSRRLGDIAAGTVVVREQPIEFPNLDALPKTLAAPRLADERYAVLETFAEQQESLELPARQRIALQLEHAFAAEIADGSSAPARVLALYAEESARRRAARLRMSTGSPAATALLASKRARWERFRSEVERLKKHGLRKLDDEAVGRFAARYRELAADLARARTYGASSGTIYALERLVGAAHNRLYRPVERPFARTGRFLLAGFPQLVRRRWLPIVLAAVLLYGTGLLTYLLATIDPQLERRLAGPEIIARAERATQGGDYRDTWNAAWLGSETLSTLIMVNNVQVSFFIFVGGIAAGIGSAVLLLFNGISLGAALAVFQNRGVLANIGAFVVPHGFIELTAIAIAGGAGLWMGSGLLLPGRQRRLDAFAARAKEAVALIGGVVAMLVVAGMIEGFFSPSRIAVGIKMLGGGVAAVATLHYLLVVGREPRADATTTSAPSRSPAGG